MSQVGETIHTPETTRALPTKAVHQIGTTHSTALGVLDTDGMNKPHLKHANNIELSPGVLYTGWYQDVGGYKMPHGKGKKVTQSPSIDALGSTPHPVFSEVRQLIANILTKTTEEGLFQNGIFVSGEKNMEGKRKMRGTFGALGLLIDGEILYENGIYCRVQNGLMVERIDPLTHTEEYGVFVVGIEYSHAKLIKGVRRVSINGSVTEEQIVNGVPKQKAYEEAWNQFQRSWNIDEVYPHIRRVIHEDSRRLFIDWYESFMDDIGQALRIGNKGEASECVRSFKRYLESIQVNRGESLREYLEDLGYPRLQQIIEDIEDIRPI